MRLQSNNSVVAYTDEEPTLRLERAAALRSMGIPEFDELATKIETMTNNEYRLVTELQFVSFHRARGERVP